MGGQLPASTDAAKPGKRIEKQALKVRDALAEASLLAAQAREASMAKDEIDANEKALLDKLRLEVYVGFYELELAAEVPAAAPPAAAPAAAPPAACHLESNCQCPRCVGELKVPRWMTS